MLRSKNKQILFSSSGQSTVEYVVVVTALIAVLMGTHSVFSEVRTVFIDKYRSYCFGISISDPPSVTFEKKIEKDSKTALNDLKEIESFIKKHSSFDIPDIPKKPTNAKEILNDFEKLL